MQTDSRRASRITSISQELHGTNHVTSNGVATIQPDENNGTTWPNRMYTSGGIINPAFDDNDNDNTKKGQKYSSVENPVYESPTPSPDIVNNSKHSEINSNDVNLDSSNKGISNPAFEGDLSETDNKSGNSRPSSRVKLDKEGAVATINSVRGSGEGMTDVDCNITPLHTTRSASSVEIIANLTETTPLRISICDKMLPFSLIMYTSATFVF